MRPTRRTVLLCFLVALLEGFDLQAGGLTAHAMSASLGLSLAQITQFLTASTLGLFIGALAGGRASDYVSRRAVLTVSIGLFGIFSIFTAIAPSPTTLVLARVATGIGIGGALPNLIALAAEGTSDFHRKKLVAWVFAGVPLGGALASCVSYGVGPSRWRLLYYVGGVLPLLLLPVVVPALKRAVPPAHERSEGPESDTISQALFRGGRLVTTIVLWVAFCFMQLSSHLLLNWLPTLMMSRGFGSSEAAIIQIAYGIVGSLGCGIVGALLSRADARKVSVGVAIWLVSMLALLAASSGGLVQVALLTGLASAGMMGCLVMNYALAPGVYPAEVRGTGIGFAVAIGRLGSIAGPALGGLLFKSHGSFAFILAAITPFVFVGALCSACVAFWTEHRKGNLK
jgi:AAHS family 3-hydroxyphenylpropionic acid transporter